MFEHLAFKGTSQIGTTDYAAEKMALAKVEAANDAYEAEYLKAVGRDEKKLAELKQAFLDAQKEAHKFVIPNQFTDVAERNGAEGLNAETGLDETMYFWSMPENRLELWAWLESGRLADVVPREFYKERDVVNRRAPHAHRLQPHRPPRRAVPGHRLRRPQLRPQQHRLAQRGAARSPPPRPWTSTRSITSARISWSPSWAM